MSVAPALRPKASLLPRILRQVRPLYLAMASVSCVIILLTAFSSSDLTNGTAAARSFMMPASLNGLFSRGTPAALKIQHPIPLKIKASEAKFNKMIASQSRSLSAAVGEYKRRYGRPPPEGFDDWYAYATKNGAVMIDEYDQLMDDLRPFWLLSGAEIRRRSLDAGLLPSVDIIRVRDGKLRTIDTETGLEDAEVGARAKGFRAMLEKFQGASLFPDPCFRCGAGR